MAISVTHATVADGTFSATGSTAWDEAHALAGLGTGVETALGVNVGTAGAVVVNGGALGTPSAGTLTNATGLPIGGISATGTPSAANFLRGDGSWAAAGGGAALSGITAATAGNTIASGNNHSQIWNWALTSDSVNAFAFGETTAATGGTSTSGVPNQSILRLTTLASSTASPLSVYSRAAHVFSVSPSTAQIFSANGTNSAPIYSFAGQTNKGFYYDSGFGAPAISAGSQMSAAFGTASTFVRPGSANSPGLTDVTTSSSGIFWTNTPAVGVTFGDESKRWTVGTTLNSYAAANATGYALNFRKARGSVASPTVITTGDDLATISGFGYVGATGTYVEACQIKFDSTGTIANTTSGVGGILRFGASVVGTVGITEVMRLQVATTTGGGWLSMDEADANPATGDLAADDAFSIYRKADKLVIAHNLAGTMNYLTIPLDGSTTTWTQGTGAP